MTKVWGTLFVGMVMLLGCGDEEVESSTPSAVDAFKRDSGLEFTRCPTVDQSWKACGNEGVDCTCGSDELAGFDCIVDALDVCTPAHLTVRTFVATGDWWQEDLIVLPGESGCQVVEFHDRTRLPSGCRTVRRRDCSDISYSNDMWGCGIMPHTCSMPVVVVEDPEGLKCVPVAE